MPLPAIAPENVTGLATDEAARRLVEFGVNDAMPAVSRGIAWRLLDRLRNPLLLLLMAASVVAAMVFYNGQLLPGADYTITGTSLALGFTPASGESIIVRAFKA